MIMSKIVILRSRDERVVNSVIFNEKQGEFVYCDRITDVQLASLIKRGYDVASYSLAVGAELKIPKTNAYPEFTISVIPKRGQQQGEDKYEIVVDGMYATKFREKEKDTAGKQDPDNFNYNYNRYPDSKARAEQPEKVIEKGIELER